MSDSKAAIVGAYQGKGDSTTVMITYRLHPSTQYRMTHVAILLYT